MTWKAGRSCFYCSYSGRSKSSIPRDVERYWMGHAAEEVGDLYSKLKDDAAFGRNGLIESAWAFSWSTLAHKTKQRPNQPRWRKPMKG